MFLPFLFKYRWSIFLTDAPKLAIYCFFLQSNPVSSRSSLSRVFSPVYAKSTRETYEYARRSSLSTIYFPRAIFSARGVYKKKKEKEKKTWRAAPRWCVFIYEMLKRALAHAQSRLRSSNMKKKREENKHALRTPSSILGSPTATLLCTNKSSGRMPACEISRRLLLKCPTRTLRFHDKYGLSLLFFYNYFFRRSSRSGWSKSFFFVLNISVKLNVAFLYEEAIVGQKINIIRIFVVNNNNNARSYPIPRQRLRLLTV